MDVLLTAEEVLGFFVPPTHAESDTITFLGVPATHHYRNGVVDDVELQVVDHRGEVVGSYYIGRVRFDRSTPSSRGRSLADVTSSFLGHACHYAHAGSVWRRWASGTPVELGEWRSQPADRHPSWLHVVQNAWFTSGRTATRYRTDEVVMIDGNGLLHPDSFFCAIGEAMNGPGGYFGSSLTGLADCLSHSSASNTAVKLVWKDYDTSHRLLGDGFSTSAVGVMREFDVSVVLQ